MTGAILLMLFALYLLGLCAIARQGRKEDSEAMFGLASFVAAVASLSVAGVVTF